MRQPSFAKLVFSNISFYRFANLWLFTAVLIAAMVITGAFFIGDSVKFTLKKRAEERIGWVSSAMFSADRWFTTEFESRFHSKLRNYFKDIEVKTAFAIKLEGSAVRTDETGRANRVNIYGVTENFWNNHRRINFNTIPQKHVLINKTLAEQLKVKAGDEIVIRIKKPSLLSYELPISLQESTYIGIRVRIHSIISGKEMGNFSLRANQLPPLNLFIRYEELARVIEKVGKANLLLCNLDSSHNYGRYFDMQLIESLSSEDCEIQMHLIRDDLAELRSQRVFIENHVIEKAMELVKTDRWKNIFDTNTTQVLTYLVNLFRHDGRQTPYSIITAANEQLIRTNIAENEIILIQWLAEDLGARPGDTVQIQFYLPEGNGKLVEVTNSFKVAGIVPHELPWFDKTLLPEIPGLARAESTQDWNLGFPLVHKFRKKDDDYWREFKGTPKAFITLSAGRKLWSNRFGELTAIRFKIKSNEIDPGILRQFADELVKNCGGASFGFIFEPIRLNALSSVENSQNFGGLFLGFSFFLVISALLLVALLFNLSIERRYQEFGIYLAVGFEHKDLAKLVLYEAMVIILIASLVGGFLGAYYSKLMLHFLSTIWQDAVGGMEWEFCAQPLSLCIGVCSATLCSIISILGTIFRLRNKSVKNIFLQGYTKSTNVSKIHRVSYFRKILDIGVPVVLIASGILSNLYLIFSKRHENAEGFFISGLLLLAGGIMLFSLILNHSGEQELSSFDSLALSLRSAKRNIKRSVLTAGIFACGFFILISVSAFRLDAGKETKSKPSGTGGFDLIADSSIPLIKDLNTEEGLNYYGLDRTTVGNVRFVQFRVKEGDEASCLNLNRAIKPRLIGCDWRFMTNRFVFSMRDRNISKMACWELLDNVSVIKENGVEVLVVPAIGDSSSIQWALGKKIGDTIDYTDEFGRRFKIKIIGGVANSILQGNLIISESVFRKLFPGESGYKFFFIDCAGSNPEEIRKTLSRSFSDYGMEIIFAARRLAEFNAVQNTYIGAFQILGGLGVLLGSAGISIILIRNVLERRNELAIMSAIGFTEKYVRNLIIFEHAMLVFTGIMLGTIPAVVSLLPSIINVEREFSFLFVFVLIVASAGLSYFWTYTASKIALRGRLIEALRVE